MASDCHAVQTTYRDCWLSDSKPSGPEHIRFDKFGNTLYDEGTAKGRQALSAVGRAYDNPPTIARKSNWTIYTQESKRGEMMYTVLDGTSKVADVAVAIRLAWPHLSNNPREYDKQMKALFERVLDSIRGSLGPYKQQPNDVIRCPTT